MKATREQPVGVHSDQRTIYSVNADRPVFVIYDPFLNTYDAFSSQADVEIAIEVVKRFLNPNQCIIVNCSIQRIKQPVTVRHAENRPKKYEQIAFDIKFFGAEISFSDI